MVTLKKILAQSAIWLLLILIYLPVLVLIAFSFNDTEILGQWASGSGWLGSGLTGDLYGRLFQNHDIGVALGNTVLIALISATVSTFLGTMGAIGAYYSKKKTINMIDGMTNISIANAEVVIAMSLTVTFVMIGNVVFHTSIFSFWTLLIGHVVLGVPFVYLNVKPKLWQMNPELYEAALDLNAKPSVAMRKVIIPQIVPGIFSGFLLSISLSLDDLIITQFTAGPGLLSGEGNIETLSTMIQSRIVKGHVPPELRPLTLFIFLAVLLVVITDVFVKNMRSKKTDIYQTKRQKIANKEEGARI